MKWPSSLSKLPWYILPSFLEEGKKNYYKCAKEAGIITEGHQVTLRDMKDNEHGLEYWCSLHFDTTRRSPIGQQFGRSKKHEPEAMEILEVATAFLIDCHQLRTAQSDGT